MKAAIFCLISFIHLGSSASTDMFEAIEVSHKISAVTAYSDRAKVARVAAPSMQKGRRWVLFGMLPDNLDRGSLQVSAKNANVEQILLERSFEYVGLDPKVKASIEELRKWYGELLEVEQASYVTEKQIQFLKKLDYKAPFSKDSNNNSFQGFDAPVSVIASSFTTSQSELSRLIDEREGRKEKIRIAREKINFRLTELQRVTDTSEQKWVSNLYVLLESEKPTSGEVKVEYMIPGAKWYPVYDVRADLNRTEGKADITLVTAGLIEQHTGENWNDVGLTLSTLDPVPLFLPVLNRWVLGEVRTERKTDNNKLELGGGGSGQHENRMRQASEKPAARVRALKDASSQEMEADSSDGDELASAEPSPQDSGLAPPPSAAPTKPSGSYGKSMKEVSAGAVASTKYPLKTLEEVYPELGNLQRKVASLDGAVGQREFVSMEAGQQAPEQTEYGDSKLPAVTAGGRKLELVSPFNIHLENDAEPYKIPLTTQLLKGDLSYFAIPKRDLRVYLRAKTRNTTSHPILAGSAQVFMQGDLVSKTDLQTINEGSHFEVELGVDPNIETKRVVRKKSSESGFINKQHSTDVEVEILVTNHHSFPIQFELRDQYPLSPKEEIAVAITQVTPSAVTEKNGDLYWKTTLRAKQKQKFNFTYTVTHPKDYLISDLN